MLYLASGPWLQRPIYQHVSSFCFYFPSPAAAQAWHRGQRGPRSSGHVLWTWCPWCWVPPSASQPCAALPITLNYRKGEREGENKRKKKKRGGCKRAVCSAGSFQPGLQVLLARRVNSGSFRGSDRSCFSVQSAPLGALTRPFESARTPVFKVNLIRRRLHIICLLDTRN